MAEAVVSSVISRISDQLIQEAVSWYGVSGEVDRLQAELKRMQCFLKDADLKQEGDERIRNWVSEIREVANDTEDIIDSFLIKVAGANEGCFLRRLWSKVPKGVALIPIGKQIKSIRTKIADISNSMQTYGMQFIGEREGSSSMVEMQRRLRRSYSHTEEEVISLEGSMRDVIAQLMAEEEHLRVVSVVGMGGLGKTTLAKKIYNHPDVKRRFDCYAWAFISQQCAAKDVLQGILSKVAREEGGAYERMREEELVGRLYQVLRAKRYLVVLDDIWRNEAWDSLKPAFPNGKKGSKVLFTTRNRDVALYADHRSSPIEPPFLTLEESWELFCRKAFPGNISQDGCPPEFKNIGKEMVKKCFGLPLAIVVLGGVLATKRSLKDWEMVQRNVNAHLNKFQHQQHYGGVNWILALSYSELPFHLKPCFLYFGLFPEDWEISKTKLIRLWIAEGFVPDHPFQRGGETMEDLAERFLEELINRCMVQVGQRDSIGRGVKTCRIHDLMRDLCVSKAREENFLEIIQQQANLMPDDPFVMRSASAKSRRIALHPLMYPTEVRERCVPVVRGCPQLRSLLCFVKGCQENIMRRRQEISIYEEFRLLRVLDLEGVNLNYRTKIPRAIGNLTHLKYLGLKSTLSIRCEVPRSIANLQSLQTLDIRATGVAQLKLPAVISKLVNLRHLLLPNSLQEGQYNVNNFKNLETLKYVDAKNLIRWGTTCKLGSLRRLGIRFQTSKEVELFLASPMVESGCLKSLHMEMVSENIPFPNLQPLAHCQNLAKLRIIGRMMDDHKGHQNLQFLPMNFSKLILRNSTLQQDPMAMLEKLPNLTFLHIGQNSYNGSKMVCSVNSFPCLEILKLDAVKIEEWQVEKGAMSSLKSLYINSLDKLRMIPDGLKSITSLRELSVRLMTKAFVNRLQVVNGVEGEDYYKVRHVPSLLTHMILP